MHLLTAQVMHGNQSCGILIPNHSVSRRSSIYMFLLFPQLKSRERGRYFENKDEITRLKCNFRGHQLLSCLVCNCGTMFNQVYWRQRGLCLGLMYM